MRVIVECIVLQNTSNGNSTLEMKRANLPQVRRVRSNRAPLDEKKYDEENLSPLKPICDNLWLLKAVAFPFKVRKKFFTMSSFKGIVTV